MKKLSYILMALVLVLGLAQCKKEQPKPQGEKVYITLKVDGGAKHTVDPADGTVTYTDGDKIYVGDGSHYIGTLTRTSGAFSGTIIEPADGTEIYFYFVGGLTPSTAPTAGTTTNFTVDLSNQSSKLPVLSCNHTTYYTAISSYACQLQNKCGLVKFVPSSPTSATVTLNGVYNRATIDFATPGITPTGATGNIALYPAADDAKWAILLPQSGATATATIGGITYAIESFPNITNNYYNNTGVNISSTEVFDPYIAPLTFEAKADGFTVTLTSDLSPLPSLEYSIDGGAWTTYTCNAATPSVNTGHTIAFRGDNSAFFIINGMSANTSTFSCSQDCYLYGNMMSLLSASDYATATSVGEFAFLNLFLNNTKIYSHDTKQLVLPATTLAPNCYGSLFNGCTALTTAPVLRATTLVNGCYSEMFIGCTNLNSVTCLATNISAENCTNNWLDGVAASGTFTANNAGVGWSEGASGIPSGWTREYLYKVVNLGSLSGNYEAQNNDILTGTLSGEYKISIADGATVTLDNVSINYPSGPYYKSGFAGITCLGDATIILKDGTTNNVAAMDYYYPGIQVGPSGKTLTIQGTGALNASYRDNNSLKSYGCGIGGGGDISCGNIVINDGTINAVAFHQAAGIGSGCCRTTSVSCGTITINGGTVTATGGAYAAGIGTGYAEGGNNSCGAISINGGTVTATGGLNAAGIGTGYSVSYKTNTCASITITSGVTQVTATKGSDAPNSIGAGNNGTCGTVTIGGVVGAITTSPYTYPAP